MGQLIILAVMGAAAGWLATRLMDVRMSTPQTIGIGVAGAVVGGMILKLIQPLIGPFIGALAGACLLIWLIQRYGRKV